MNPNEISQGYIIGGDLIQQNTQQNKTTSYICTMYILEGEWEYQVLPLHINSSGFYSIFQYATNIRAVNI